MIEKPAGDTHALSSLISDNLRELQTRREIAAERGDKNFEYSGVFAVNGPVKTEDLIGADFRVESYLMYRVVDTRHVNEKNYAWREIGFPTRPGSFTTSRKEEADALVAALKTLQEQAKAGPLSCSRKETVRSLLFD